MLFELESESLRESSEGELGCSIVAPLAEGLGSTDGININDVELSLFNRGLHTLLIGKQLGQLHD